MTRPAVLTRSNIDALLDGATIGSAHPWSTSAPDEIERHYRRVCADIESTCRVKSRIDWDHYGSGYASFIDAWFYREDSSFPVVHRADYEHEHTGLVVLMSRSSPFYAMAEGEKGWDTTRGYSYMPALDSVDCLNTPSVEALAVDCERILSLHGMVRIHAEELRQPLPPEVRIQTNLSGSTYTYFDALFNWDD
jgi:hypothetical protein